MKKSKHTKSSTSKSIQSLQSQSSYSGNEPFYYDSYADRYSSSGSNSSMSEQVFYSPSHTVSDGSITVGTVNVTNTIGKPGAFYYKTVWNPKYLSYKTTLQPAGEPGYITNVKVGPQGSNMYVRVLYDGGASGNGVPNNKTAYSETQWTYLGTPYTWKNSPYGSGNVQYKIGPTIPGATRTIDFYSTDPVDIS